MNNALFAALAFYTFLCLAWVLGMSLLLWRMIVDLNAKIDAIGARLASLQTQQARTADQVTVLTAQVTRLVDTLCLALGVDEPAAQAHPAPKPVVKK